MLVQYFGPVAAADDADAGDMPLRHRRRYFYVLNFGI